MSYHDISPSDDALLNRQLRWVSRNWEFVSPDKFADMIDGISPITEDSVLLTFDDGAVSNLRIAQNILKPLGIKALFFVVTEYVELKESDNWREFVVNNITLSGDPQAITEDYRNMSVADLCQLMEWGHTIGSHTASHTRLSTLDEAGLRQEIVTGADRLETLLGNPVRHFAYPFGDLNSISADASLVARERFDFTYTGMRGDNGRDRIAWHLCRESNDPRDSLWFTGACLEGGADFVYTDKLAECRGWPA